MKLKTNGISPKAILAFLMPFITTLGGSISVWLATGDFDTTELGIAASGLLMSALAGLGAYIGDPGDVRVVPKEDEEK